MTGPWQDRNRWRRCRYGRSACPVCRRTVAVTGGLVLYAHHKPGVGAPTCAGSGLQVPYVAVA